MRKSELQEQWRERIADYRASGLTAKQWCSKTGFTIGQLHHWVVKINKLTPKTDPPSWAKMEIVDSPEVDEASDGKNETSKITVCVGVARIEVESGFDRGLLGEVMRVAAAICSGQ